MIELSSGQKMILPIGIECDNFLKKLSSFSEIVTYLQINKKDNGHMVWITANHTQNLIGELKAWVELLKSYEEQSERGKE